MNKETQNSNVVEEVSQHSETSVGVCAETQDHGESAKLCDPEDHHGNTESLLSAASHEPVRCPTYTYHQTTDDVTFILHVTVVKETTLIKSFEPQRVSTVWLVVSVGFKFSWILRALLIHEKLLSFTK